MHGFLARLIWNVRFLRRLMAWSGVPSGSVAPSTAPPRIAPGGRDGLRPAGSGRCSRPLRRSKPRNHQIIQQTNEAGPSTNARQVSRSGSDTAHLGSAGPLYLSTFNLPIAVRPVKCAAWHPKTCLQTPTPPKCCRRRAFLLVTTARRRDPHDCLDHRALHLVGPRPTPQRRRDGSRRRRMRVPHFKRTSVGVCFRVLESAVFRSSCCGGSLHEFGSAGNETD